MNTFKSKLILLGILAFLTNLRISARDVSIEDALDLCRQKYGFSPNYYSVETSNASQWTLFVDLFPTAMWCHDAYMVTIAKVTSDLQEPTMEESHRIFPPSANMNLIGLSSSSEDSSAGHAPEKDINQLLESIAPQISNEYASRTYAIILNGGINLNSNKIGAWNSCSLAYRMLLKFGVPRDHIIPISADGDNSALDTSDDTDRWEGEIHYGMYNPKFISQRLDLGLDGVDVIHYSATKENIYKAFTQISNKAKDGDHFLFFGMDHGTTVIRGLKTEAALCLWDAENVASETDSSAYIGYIESLHYLASELKRDLKTLSDKGVICNAVLGQCRSGGFIEPLSSLPNIVVSTACTGTETAHTFWIPELENGNRIKRPYSEFLYQWVNGILNSCGEPLEDRMYNLYP